MVTLSFGSVLTPEILLVPFPSSLLSLSLLVMDL